MAEPRVSGINADILPHRVEPAALQIERLECRSSRRCALDQDFTRLETEQRCSKKLSSLRVLRKEYGASACSGYKFIDDDRDKMRNRLPNILPDI